MRTIRTDRAARALGLSLLILCAITSASFAATSDMKVFKSHYKIRTAQLSQCTVCHLPDDETKLNAYGKDWMEAGRNEPAFQTIERRDSDRDGYSNRLEITEDSNPGDASLIPATGEPDAASRRSRPPELDDRGPTTPPADDPDDDPFGSAVPGRSETTPPADPGATRVAPGRDPFATGDDEPVSPTAPADDWTVTEPQDSTTTSDDPFATGPTTTTAPTGPTTVTPAVVQPTGPVPSVAPGAAPGDPFDGYPVLYRVAEPGSSSIHLLQNGVDTIISQGVSLVETFGWSPDGQHAWFVSSTGELFIWNGQAARLISGPVVVDADVVAWSPTGRTVFFGSFALDEQNVFYGVTVPDGEVHKVLETPSGRLTAMDVAPKQ